MPAAYYDFKATPEERSFGEQMGHIAASLFERFSQIGGIAPVKSALPKTITKEFAIEWLNPSFDYVIQTLPKLTEDQLSKSRFKVDFEGRPGPEINGRDMIMNIFVHVADHRAQCEVIHNPSEGGFFEFSSTLEIDFADNPSTILGDPALYPQKFATPGAVVGMAQAVGNPYFLVSTKQLGDRK